MCRIAGILCEEGVEITSYSKNLHGMLGRMEKGGPDDEGIDFSGQVAFGHRRLSIIDLSPAGHQPMKSSDAEISITFNGEIYNYQILRKELVAEGVSFQTYTDTEVIMEAYRMWGTASFARLLGMFAFALYDKQKGMVFLVRDHQGIKPLYFGRKLATLVFSSEVDAFNAFDPGWKSHPHWKIYFLAFGFLPHPITTLEGVYSLARGSFMEINLSGLHVREVAYLNTSEASEETTASVNDEGIALEMIREKLGEAVTRHLISDAPLGVFLSGGIDSSLLAILAGKQVASNLRTVSVNFKETAFDEGQYQKIVLDKLPNHSHQSYLVDEEMLWDSLEDIWRAMDQPSIDGINSYFVSQCAHQAGLKAVLSGVGADELFGGYASIQRVQWIHWLRKIPAKGWLSNSAKRRKDAYGRLVFLRLHGPVGDYLFLRGINTPGEIANMLHISENEIWNVLQSLPSGNSEGMKDTRYAAHLESSFYMNNQLLKDTDYMSMHFGLEVRVPFLDQELMALVRKINDHIRFKRERPKFLLTKAFEDVLPAEIVFRRKQGFVFPFQNWLENGIKGGRFSTKRNKDILHQSKDFLNGRIHWSKPWSEIVVDNFQMK